MLSRVAYSNNQLVHLLQPCAPLMLSAPKNTADMDLIGIASFGGVVCCMKYLSTMRPSASVAQSEMKLHDKFADKPGITFYYFPRSPCARRVWLTLLHKNIECNFVMVDLLAGEQRHPEYLKINPQGKVPAIRVYNHPTIPDSTLYESQAIVEWLEEQFPDTLRLYPTPAQLIEYTNVKMWQYWELTLAEEIWPLSRQQVDGVVWRLMFSRANFYVHGPPSQQSDDPFYKQKVTDIYEGRYMTNQMAERSILRILSGFQMLENTLKSVPNGSCDFVLGGDVMTQADVACYPRLCKMPQNGIVSTQSERSLFPNVMKYFEFLKDQPAFQKFKTADEDIWNSGVYPKFIPQWWSKVVPWWLCVWIGNMRSGCHEFKRVTQSSLNQQVLSEVLRHTTSLPQSILPHLKTPTNSKQHDIFLPSDVTLYYNATLPFSRAVECCLDLLSFRCVKSRVNIMRLQQYSSSFKQLMPFSEVPVLVLGSKVIYGPQIIIEFVMNLRAAPSQVLQLDQRSVDCSQLFGDVIAPSLIMPESAVGRAVMRRWFGWSHTAWHYQIQHIHLHKVLIPAIRRRHATEDSFKASIFSDVSAIDNFEYIDAYVHPKSEQDLHAYVSEMAHRINSLECELSSSCSCAVFLVGESIAPSYADIFVLLVILIAASCGADLSPVRHPRTVAWARTLMQLPVVEKYVLEMVYACSFDKDGVNLSFILDTGSASALLSRESQLRRHFTSQAGDIFICGYPHSGCAELCDALCASFPASLRRMAQRPMEFAFCNEDISCAKDKITDTDAVDWAVLDDRSVSSQQTLQTRRIFCSHSTADNFCCKPKHLHPLTRIIYMACNPREVVTEMYAASGASSSSAAVTRAATFDDYFDMFMSGTLQTGSWFQHNADWYRAHFPATGKSSAPSGVQQVLNVYKEELRSQHTIHEIISFLTVGESDSADVAHRVASLQSTVSSALIVDKPRELCIMSREQIGRIGTIFREYMPAELYKVNLKLGFTATTSNNTK